MAPDTTDRPTSRPARDEVRLRQTPVALDRGGRRIGRVGRFLDAQPTKEAALDDLSQPGILAFEPSERASNSRRSSIAPGVK